MAGFVASSRQSLSVDRRLYVARNPVSRGAPSPGNELPGPQAVLQRPAENIIPYASSSLTTKFCPNRTPGHWEMTCNDQKQWQLQRWRRRSPHLSLNQHAKGVSYTKAGICTWLQRHLISPRGLKLLLGHRELRRHQNLNWNIDISTTPRHQQRRRQQ